MQKSISKSGIDIRDGFRNLSKSNEYLMGSKSVIVRAKATKLPAPEPLPGPTGIPSAFAHFTISATIRK